MADSITLPRLVPHPEVTVYVRRGWRSEAATRPAIRLTGFLTSAVVLGGDAFGQLPEAWTGAWDAGMGIRGQAAESFEWGMYGSAGRSVGPGYAWLSAGRMKLFTHADGPGHWVTTTMVGGQGRESRVGWLAGVLWGRQDMSCTTTPCRLVIRGYLGMVLDDVKRWD